MASPEAGRENGVSRALNAAGAAETSPRNCTSWRRSRAAFVADVEFVAGLVEA